MQRLRSFRRQLGADRFQILESFDVVAGVAAVLFNGALTEVGEQILHGHGAQLRLRIAHAESIHEVTHRQVVDRLRVGRADGRGHELRLLQRR